MGLNDTPSGERTHIGFFGVRNAGKQPRKRRYGAGYLRGKRC